MGWSGGFCAQGPLSSWSSYTWQYSQRLLRHSIHTTRIPALQLAAPGGDHLMGTDNLQRDVWSRIVYGSQTILMVSVLAAIISSFVGIFFGLISGYAGGTIDSALSLVMDAVYVFPGLILAIALAAMFGPGVINITFAVAVIYIPTYFRLVRGQTLAIKQELYVEAARAIGASGFTILMKYIFPNVIATTVVVFTLNVADAIMIEAALTYLGLGLPPSIVDWGMDLAMGKEVPSVWNLVAYHLSGYDDLRAGTRLHHAG